MGIVRFEETEKAELEEFRRMLLSCAAVHRRKDDDGFGGRENALPAGNGDVLDRLVCVTSGVSYLGIAVVNQLLVNGYSVRIIVDNEGELVDFLLKSMVDRINLVQIRFIFWYNQGRNQGVAAATAPSIF